MEARGAIATAMMTMTTIWEWYEKGLEWVQRSPYTTPFWTSVGVVSATTLVLFFLHLKLRVPDTVLLIGLSGSGKTVLFYQLRDGCCQPLPVESQGPNEERFILHSETSWSSKVTPVHVVDLPRTSHLQGMMDRYLCKAAGIVFVVDATEILWNCKSVSKYLYEIWTRAVVVKKKIPILILCNKTDKLNAHSKEFIASQLEKQVGKLCSPRTGMKETNTLNGVASGVGRKKFLFSNCQTQVTISEAAGLSGDIAQLELFIRKCVQY